MRWKGRRQSTNVEDRRGKTPKKVLGGGIGTIIIVLIVYMLGGDPQNLLDNMQTGQQSSVSNYVGSEQENELLAQIIATARDAVVTILCKGTKAGMNQFNSKLS